MTELLFTTKDVADMLQVDKSPVKRWAHDGKQVYFWKTGAQEVRRGRSALLEGKMDEVKGMNYDGSCFDGYLGEKRIIFDYNSSRKVERS